MSSSMRGCSCFTFIQPTQPGKRGKYPSKKAFFVDDAQEENIHQVRKEEKAVNKMYTDRHADTCKTNRYRDTHTHIHTHRHYMIAVTSKAQSPICGPLPVYRDIVLASQASQSPQPQPVNPTPSTSRSNPVNPKPINAYNPINPNNSATISPLTPTN